jgi:hypothetical protein
LQPYSVLQNEFISFLIIHESCSPIRVDEFGFLNCLISILEAQDIPVWISKRESREFYREKDFNLSFALKTLLLPQFYWSLFLGHTLGHIGMLGIGSFWIRLGDPFFYQPDCCQILFFKTILSHFESFMKVVVLHV